MLTLFARRLGSVVPVTLAILLVTAAVRAQMPCGYKVTALIQAEECPPFGFPPTIGTAISEPVDGGLPNIVGYYQSCVIGPARAFLWTGADGKFVTLDMPPGTGSAKARDISADGTQIVGEFDIPGDGLTNIAFLIDGNEFIQIPPPAGAFSNAEAVSLGRVLGTTSDSDGPPYSHKAYLWDEARMTIIEPTFGPRSAGGDINGAGPQIVGWMGTGIATDSHAFVWHDGFVIDLGIIPDGFAAQAQAVNNLGAILITGSLQKDKDSPVLSRSFLWEDGEMTDLGLLPGFDRCGGFDLNDAGVAVGVCSMSANPNVQRGFVWKDGVMADLNDLIPVDSDLLINWGTAVANAGQITGRATSSTGVVAFLLTPIQPPLGDLDSDCAVGITDLLILLSNWGPCPPKAACPADLDGDGGVGILDLLTLLANWGQ
ncbi:MAG: hypothetical protein IH830_03605 [Planctomycetes bacterium]|nr:hypothetical protein [Planctomycetota bacterium]